MHFKSACCKSLPWFYSRGGSIMAAKKNWPSLLSRKWYNTKYRLYWYWTMTLVDLSSLTGMWWQLSCLSFCWLTPTKKESPTTLRDPSLLLVTLSLSLVSFLSHLPPVVLLNTRMDSWANSIPWISWPDPHRRNPNILIPIDSEIKHVHLNVIGTQWCECPICWLDDFPTCSSFVAEPYNTMGDYDTVILDIEGTITPITFVKDVLVRYTHDATLLVSQYFWHFRIASLSFLLSPVVLTRSLSVLGDRKTWINILPSCVNKYVLFWQQRMCTDQGKGERELKKQVYDRQTKMFKTSYQAL